MIAKSSAWMIGLLAAFLVGGVASTLVTSAPSGGPSAEPESKPVGCSQALCRWLDLTEPEAGAIAEHDPQFSGDMTRLRGEVDAVRQQTIALFEEPGATDGQLRAQIEAWIEARNRLDRRVAEHLLLIRDHLTPGQQRRLFNLCAGQMRKCGSRTCPMSRGDSSPAP